MRKATSNKRRETNNKTKRRQRTAKNEIELNNLNTWTIQGGQVERKIDYIMINKYRNTVRKERAEQHWRGNMAQQRQRAAIRLEIMLKLVRNYGKPPPETGKRIKYDLAALRVEPAKLENGKMIKMAKEIPVNQIKTTTGNSSKKIQRGLQECYPPTQKNHETQKPDNLDPTTLNAQWWTKGEIDKEEEETSRRKELQTSTHHLGGKLKTGKTKYYWRKYRDVGRNKRERPKITKRRDNKQNNTKRDKRPHNGDRNKQEGETGNVQKHASPQNTDIPRYRQKKEKGGSEQNHATPHSRTHSLTKND